MSDGVSDGYRAAEASNWYRNQVDSWFAEHILLGEQLKQQLSVEQMIEEVRKHSLSTEIKFDSGYYRNKGEVEIDLQVEGVYKKIPGKSLEGVLVDALLYIEFCKSEQGKKATKTYLDW